MIFYAFFFENVRKIVKEVNVIEYHKIGSKIVNKYIIFS